MESQQKDRDENLFDRDTTNDFSSGPLAVASDDGDENLSDEDEAEEESAADDELDEDL